MTKKVLPSLSTPLLEQKFLLQYHGTLATLSIQAIIVYFCGREESGEKPAPVKLINYRFVKQDVNVETMQCVKTQFASVQEVSLVTHLLAAQSLSMEKYPQTKVSANFVSKNTFDFSKRMKSVTQFLGTLEDLT